MSKDIQHRNSKGELHNENGPAYVRFYRDGQKKYEEYCIKGNLHNKNEPAIIFWHENGQKRYEGYYIDGKRHNENGPACIYWYDSGQKHHEEYWIDGKELTKEDFLQFTSQKPVEVESKVQIPKQG
ncbi:MAG: hypothetical protein GY853_05635, partial [PVC group bacterium]|nr:hypothetical protein [PVC group bacterium]